MNVETILSFSDRLAAEGPSDAFFLSLVKSGIVTSALVEDLWKHYSSLLVALDLYNVQVPMLNEKTANLAKKAVPSPVLVQIFVQEFAHHPTSELLREGCRAVIFSVLGNLEARAG
jgi:hypothetical protein